MGSIEDEDVFTVLVTGFAPFKKEYPKNPSWDIAHALPEYLPPRATAEAETAPLPRVRIVVFPVPIRVNYEVVRGIVPRLWDGQAVPLESATELPGAPAAPAGPAFQPPRRIDVLLHIGMAGPRLHYAIERFGRRDGYALGDVDARLPAVDRDSPDWAWYGVPPALETHIDLDEVLQRWRGHTTIEQAQPDLRISSDAGRYLCDFTYFSSLAHLYRRKKEADEAGKADKAPPADTTAPTAAAPPTWPDPDRRRVVFLHVPAAASPERIAFGRALAIELIRSLAETELAARHTKQLAAEQTGPAAAETAAVPAAGADTATGLWYRE